MSKALYHGQPGDTAGNAYSAATVTTTITAFTVFNGSGGAETLDIWLVPSAGAPVDANKIIEGLSVADGETKGVQEIVAHTLAKGERIVLQASTADALTVRITGHQHA